MSKTVQKIILYVITAALLISHVAGIVQARAAYALTVGDTEQKIEQTQGMGKALQIVIILFLVLVFGLSQYYHGSRKAGFPAVNKIILPLLVVMELLTLLFNPYYAGKWTAVLLEFFGMAVSANFFMLVLVAGERMGKPKQQKNEREGNEAEQQS